MASYEYSLDGNGMQTGVTMEDGTASYILDSLNRLTREDVASASLGTFTRDYVYDAAGNRLDPGVTYGPDNRLLTDSHGTYGYDGNGNVISRGTETFGYDSNNRLIFYTNGTTTASYEYDYVGRRVTRTVDGDVTQYLYDGQNIIAEYLSGIQVARYIHGLGMDKPLMVVRNGQTYFYHTDGLGSVVAITDEAGQVVQRYGYDAWGNIVYTDGSFSFMGSGLVNTLTYTAREYDAESGLYHYRARAYDPAVGRFLQKDALPGKLARPQTQNLYSYVMNNPVNLTDPTGNCVMLAYTLLIHFFRGIQWKPPCIPGAAMSIGAEAHYVLGLGLDVYFWCDQECNLWLITMMKIGLGAARGYSPVGVNVFPWTENRKDCPDLGGITLEGAIGPVEGILGFGDGRLIPGGGVSMGELIKVTVCYNRVLDKRIIGRCD